MRPLSDFAHWRTPSHYDENPTEGGAFMFRRRGTKLRVIASNGEGWDHVSVSTERRCPTWEEMNWIAIKFFGAEPAYQLHVPEALHVNYHPHCLHWWRPQRADLPLPPTWMVGPRNGQTVLDAVLEAERDMARGVSRET